MPVDESLGLVDDYLTRPAAELGCAPRSSSAALPTTSIVAACDEPGCAGEGFNVHKRYLLHVAGHNLSLLMRQLIGAGTPREAVAGGYGGIFVLLTPTTCWWHGGARKAARRLSPPHSSSGGEGRKKPLNQRADEALTLWVKLPDEGERGQVLPPSFSEPAEGPAGRGHRCVPDHADRPPRPGAPGAGPYRVQRRRARISARKRRTLASTGAGGFPASTCSKCLREPPRRCRPATPHKCSRSGTARLSQESPN